MFDKLKTRWGAQSTAQFLLIMLVFSAAGCGILWVKKPVYHLLHISGKTSLWIKIPLLFFIYQALLLLAGALAGQFCFFWAKEKKLFYWLTKPFRLLVPSQR